MAARTDGKTAADKPKADKPKADKPKADKPKADKPKSPVKVPASVKVIGTNESAVDKLRQQLAEKETALATSLTARETELTTSIDGENTRHTGVIAGLQKQFDENIALATGQHTEIVTTLTTELNEIRAKLNKPPQMAIELGEKPVVPLSNGDQFEYVDAKLPKKLIPKLGEGRDENYWHQLLQPQFDPNSLDEFIVLVAFNADGQDVSNAILAAACKGLGHKSKAKDFEHSVAARCNALRTKNVLTKGHANGWNLLTKTGIKSAKKLLADRPPAADGEPESEPVIAGLDAFVFMAVSKGARLDDIAEKVIAAGYALPEGKTMKDFRPMLTDSLTRLRNAKSINVSGQELALSAQGKKQAKAIAA